MSSCQNELYEDGAYPNLPPRQAAEPALIRKFETGATRDGDAGKIDPEGALSPLVIERYGKYMYDCSVMADGSKRPSDNWQKGIPITSYMKSLWRHTLDVWKIHRGLKVYDQKTGKEVTLEQALCACMFNTMGYLHEILKDKEA